MIKKQKTHHHSQLLLLCRCPFWNRLCIGHLTKALQVISDFQKLAFKTSGFVSALAKLLREKSKHGWLSSHGRIVEIDEMKMSSV